MIAQEQNKYLGVDSLFHSAILPFKNRSPFPTRVLGGLLERSGSLERMGSHPYTPVKKKTTRINPKGRDATELRPMPGCGVDSLSMFFSHHSFQKPIAISDQSFGWLARKIGIPGKNGKLPLDSCKKDRIKQKGRDATELQPMPEPGSLVPFVFRFWLYHGRKKIFRPRVVGAHI